MEPSTTNSLYDMRKGKIELFHFKIVYFIICYGTLYWSIYFVCFFSSKLVLRSSIWILIKVCPCFVCVCVTLMPCDQLGKFLMFQSSLGYLSSGPSSPTLSTPGSPIEFVVSKSLAGKCTTHVFPSFFNIRIVFFFTCLAIWLMPRVCV